MRILDAVDAGIAYINDVTGYDITAYDVYYSDCDYFLMDTADSVPLVAWGTMEDHYRHIERTHARNDPYVAEMRDNFVTYPHGMSFEVHRPMPVKPDFYKMLPRDTTTSWRSRYGNTLLQLGAVEKLVTARDGKVTSLRDGVGVLWLSNRDEVSWETALMRLVRDRFQTPSKWELTSLS